jgi:hypothetical protein
MLAGVGLGVVPPRLPPASMPPILSLARRASSQFQASAGNVAFGYRGEIGSDINPAKQ